eukprot:CAMPEP_0119307138 /NCGR_PEP_ID=MMETSP1333-20130426/7713_1 /TAXON_ID=418940 /ORGANISM="Scyphosphaera apsteinii, Strain RCC1455" /LENGTH=154 /DNA_ID=CAMNT_0007310611 /DNA_START=55 /DNA_END=519 /DNA_ORIENTATION=+
MPVRKDYGPKKYTPYDAGLPYRSTTCIPKYFKPQKNYSNVGEFAAYELSPYDPGGFPNRFPAMSLVNQEYLAQKIEQLDQAGTAMLLQRTANQSAEALSSANAALQAGQVTLELSKDVAPVLAEMKAIVTKLELIDQRLQAVEKKMGESSCAIL